MVSSGLNLEKWVYVRIFNVVKVNKEAISRRRGGHRTEVENFIIMWSAFLRLLCCVELLVRDTFFSQKLDLNAVWQLFTFSSRDPRLCFNSTSSKKPSVYISAPQRGSQTPINWDKHKRFASLKTIWPTSFYLRSFKQTGLINVIKEIRFANPEKHYKITIGWDFWRHLSEGCSLKGIINLKWE